MSEEMIKTGQWVFKEGGVPEYFVYKLLKIPDAVSRETRELPSEIKRLYQLNRSDVKELVGE
ncbi:MAG: hypothetical protein JRH19_19840 [Deltaproteobacteria bacterium]|nr:hypothetical protein [Deltaproteobacteria bacterium]